MKKYFFTIFLLSFLFTYSSYAINKEEVKKSLTLEEQPSDVLSLFQRDYVLLKRNQIEVENNLSYIYYSSNKIYLNSFAILDPLFLTLGKFGIENTRRHIFNYILALRWGLLDNVQAEINIPYVYRHERFSKIGSTNSQIPAENVLDDYGIGDISFALSIQPIRETGKIPAVILAFAYKTKTGKSPYEIDNFENEAPTGSGYYAFRFGVNLLKSIDPVALFGGLAYSYNQPETINKIYDGNRLEKIYPGDTISLNLGIAYALSYNFSINFQFLQDYTLTTKTKINGVKRDSPNSTLNSAIFKFGTGWAISRNLSLSVGLGMGLTIDAPDYILEFRIPYKF